MTLPQETIDRIDKDASNYYSTTKFPSILTAYVCGATAEATRAIEMEKVLVDFIKKFISRHEAGLLPDRFLYDEALKALTNYAGEKEVGNG